MVVRGISQAGEMGEKELTWRAKVSCEDEWCEMGEGGGKESDKGLDRGGRRGGAWAGARTGAGVGVLTEGDLGAGSGSAAFLREGGGAGGTESETACW